METFDNISNKETIENGLKAVFSIFESFALRDPHTRHSASFSIGPSTILNMEYRPGTRHLFYSFMYNSQTLEKISSTQLSNVTGLCDKEHVESFRKNISNISKFSMNKLDKTIEKLMDKHIEEIDSLDIKER